VDNKDRTLSEEEIQLLDDFGTVYGRVLSMAHRFAAEKKASTNRDTFMSFASHEIKNPLMALTSYIQLLQRSLEKKSEVKTEWVSKMADEAARMKSLINELLNVRHPQGGTLTYNKTEMSLRELLTQVIDHFKVRYPKRKLRITYEVTDEKLHILGDQVKLSQVFINLLNNAHKFSDATSIINITVSQRESLYIVTVADKGIGISADELPFIFKEFYRGSNGENKKGRGVGLFLVKSILENHNGSIAVQSTLGKGTTFSITLPLQSST
jgi:signal transduction histidine kinase